MHIADEPRVVDDTRFVVSPTSSPPSPDLSAVFDEHFDYLWSTLRRLGVRDADREDLVHEVFLKVHMRLGDYDASRPFRPWLFGFAYRVAIDYHRLARHRVEVLGRLGDTPAANVPADEAIAESEEREFLLTALDTLDLERRAVLVMHDVDEVPTHEIARQLDIPLNTVYSRLRLARKQLANAVTKLGVERGVR
jgi:RNA polymerase sigma-70 factor (ECF subfamily)